MRRYATIHIHNLTGYPLTLTADKVFSGQFDAAPPKEISVGETATFAVVNALGALIGPKGSITYTLSIPADGNTTLATLTFFWNHPFNTASSSYSVNDHPFGLSKSAHEVRILKGGDHDVVFSVSLA